MKKIKIYYLLSRETELKPISGDRINEMNVIRSLCKYFDVYYNGVLCDPSMSTFGRTDKQLSIPKKNEYNLVYVRNNKDVFLQSPSPKLWFASPYDEECFDMADGIVCMTEPWKERLSSYTEKDYDYFVSMYPRKMKAPKHCLLFPQVIKLFTDKKINEIKMSRDIQPPKRGFFSNLFTKSISEAKIISHFGPIRPSNYPHQLIHALAVDPLIGSSVTAQCIGPGKKLTLPKSIIKTSRVPQKEAFNLLINSDAIWYNQDASGNVAGSLKVLEAMAVGTPVLTPRYDARECELGIDYPFFWELEKRSAITDADQPDFIKKLKLITLISKEQKDSVSKYLRFKAEKHSIESSALVLRSEIESFLQEVE